MRVGSKGKYAVQAIMFIAQQDHRNPMSLSEINKLHDISLSYLEQLFSKLRQAGVVKSVRGPGGGYILSKSPDRIKISEIIEAVESTRSRMLAVQWHPELLPGADPIFRWLINEATQ